MIRSVHVSRGLLVALIGLFAAACSAQSSTTFSSTSMVVATGPQLVLIWQNEDGSCSMNRPYVQLSPKQKIEWAGFDKNGTQRKVAIGKVQGKGKLKNDNPKAGAFQKRAKTEAASEGWYCYSASLFDGSTTLCTIDPEICIKGGSNSCPAAPAKQATAKDKCPNTVN